MSSTIREDQVDTATMPILDIRRKPGKIQIRGALRYDLDALLAAEKLTLPFNTDRGIAVYADNDTEADAIVEKLRGNGFPKAARLEGGIELWLANGLPTEDVTQEQPIPGVPEAGLRDV